MRLNFFYIVIVCLLSSNGLLGQYTLEDLQKLTTQLREEKARIEAENSRLETLQQAKDRANAVLERRLAAKDIIIEHLKRNLDEAMSVIESQKRRIELIEEIRSKDSIRLTREILQMKQDYDATVALYKEIVDDYKIDLKRVYDLLFDKTFSVTSTLSEPCLVCPKRPTGRVELDEGNSINIKSNQINAIYIEFSTGKTDVELPSYYFTLMVYPDNKGQQPYKLYEDYPIVTQNGEMNHQIEINNKSRIVSGRYVLTLTYEEDEQPIKKERVFTLR